MGRVEQALHAAIFAKFSVQRGKHHVQPGVELRRQRIGVDLKQPGGKRTRERNRTGLAGAERNVAFCGRSAGKNRDDGEFHRSTSANIQLVERPTPNIQRPTSSP